MNENGLCWSYAHISTDAVKNLYSRLQDQESRDVFTARLMHMLTGDDELIWKLTDKLYDAGVFSSEISELLALQKSGKKIILHGAGEVGERAKIYFERHGLCPDLFCDKNEDKQRNGYLNLPVVSLQELVENQALSVAVLTVSPVYAGQIKRELAESGFHSEVYDFFVNHVICGYFDWDFLKPVDNEILIDGGVLDGGDIMDFIKFTGGEFEKVYGFEPDALSYQRSIDNVSKFERVKIINKGLWREDAVLSFHGKGDGFSRISDEGSTQISVTPIDEAVGDDKVTFIKMDVECAELEALRGAAKTIIRCKPRCAISIYHKPEDIIELPLYLLSLVHDYRFYLRHCTIGTVQTVLYAI